MFYRLCSVSLTRLELLRAFDAADEHRREEKEAKRGGQKESKSDEKSISLRVSMVGSNRKLRSNPIVIGFDRFVRLASRTHVGHPSKVARATSAPAKRAR
jgi:hypothetical protein